MPLLKDLISIPERVHQGDFVLQLRELRDRPVRRRAFRDPRLDPDQGNLSTRRGPQLKGERQRLLGKGRAVERDDHVQAARAAGHREARQPELVEHRLDVARGALDLAEVVDGRVEVDDQPIGPLEVGQPARPAVEGQR